MSPSTTWQERIAPDEEQRLARLAEALAAMQRRGNEKAGAGRALHRKGVAALRGTLEVKDGLPAHARHGMFRSPARLDVRVRLSNGAARRQHDRVGDIRGFSVQVQLPPGAGDSVFGGPASTQDLLFINREVFGFRDAEPFIQVALAAERGPLAVAVSLVRSFGFLSGLAQLRRLASGLGAPFSGFLSERFYTAVPIACGAYAMRLRLSPGRPARARSKEESLADDVAAQLGAGPSVHDLEAQFFVDEQSTPIEDASVNWDEAKAPWVSLATLTLPAQSLTDDAARALAEEVERARFDPWNALAEHRPLGHVQRARKAAYFASQAARGAR